MINSNATNINEQMSFYSTLSVVLLIVAVVFFITAVVLWFVLKIPHSFRVLTGVGADKEIKQISTDTVAGKGYSDGNRGKAVVAWNASGNLSMNLNNLPKPNAPQNLSPQPVISNMAPGQDETELLEDDSTMVLDDATMVLEDDATMVLQDYEIDPEATVVLTNPMETLPPSDDFEIEEEIVITGVDNRNMRK